jgi:hypothetical protein
MGSKHGEQLSVTLSEAHKIPPGNEGMCRLLWKSKRAVDLGRRSEVVPRIMEHLGFFGTKASRTFARIFFVLHGFRLGAGKSGEGNQAAKIFSTANAPV